MQSVQNEVELHFVLTQRLSNLFGKDMLEKGSPLHGN